MFLSSSVFFFGESESDNFQEEEDNFVKLQGMTTFFYNPPGACGCLLEINY